MREFLEAINEYPVTSILLYMGLIFIIHLIIENRRNYTEEDE